MTDNKYMEHLMEDMFAEMLELALGRHSAQIADAELHYHGKTCSLQGKT